MLILDFLKNEDIYPQLDFYIYFNEIKIYYINNQ
jgi:hypothetical protein